MHQYYKHYKHYQQQKILLKIILVFTLSIFTFMANNSLYGGATIVGGKEAEPYSYPFMVSIQYKKTNKHFCGGALISPSTVVTAAHCTTGESASDLKVVLAEHNLKVEEGVEQSIDVSKIIIHKKYSSWTMENDISILRLSSPVTLGMNAQLITLPEPQEEFSGNTTIIGWGRLSSGGKAPDILNKAKIKLIDFEKCKSDYNSKIFPGMICASAPGKDTCQGDSGGPLFKDNKLIGITSWGKGCADPKYPGVYTQVSNYIDFINENTFW